MKLKKTIVMFLLIVFIGFCNANENKLTADNEKNISENNELKMVPALSRFNISNVYKLNNNGTRELVSISEVIDFKTFKVSEWDRFLDVGFLFVDKNRVYIICAFTDDCKRKELFVLSNKPQYKYLGHRYTQIDNKIFYLHYYICDVSPKDKVETGYRVFMAADNKIRVLYYLTVNNKNYLKGLIYKIDGDIQNPKSWDYLMN